MTAALAVRLPWHPALSVPAVDTAIVWQIRLPRVVLGALVGAMLAGGGAAYQGVFRNPLADPYLLGVAAGGGLGATIVIIAGASPALLPPAAFVGAAAAVAITYVLGAGRRSGPGAGPVRSTPARPSCWPGWRSPPCSPRCRPTCSRQHSQTLQAVYSWILGGLSKATWSDVALIAALRGRGRGRAAGPPAAAGRAAGGRDRSQQPGAGHSPRLRLIVVLAATLGTAAAVSVSGLIGFVGIIVPHTVRLTAGPSYRVMLPVSMIGGAAFLVLADVVARTVQAPAEVPIGVITALAGAPFFLFVLRSRRARQDLA